MIGLNHVLTGAAIGIAVEQPVLVAALAFASHFVLDAMPHFGGTPIYEFGHKHFAKVMVGDGVVSVLALLIITMLAPHAALAIVTGAAFAVLPDAILLHYYLNGRPKMWFHRFHLGIQWFERPPGAFVEVSYCIFMCTVLTAQLLH